MKENKIYRGYHHEDLTLKFLKENTAKYIAKITNAKVSDEINYKLHRQFDRISTENIPEWKEKMLNTFLGGR